MPNSSKEIDSILENIKKRKEERGITSSSISSGEDLSAQILAKKALRETKATTDDSTDANPALETFLKQESTPSNLNPSNDDKKEEADDKFSEFFTKTVAVTKTPEQLVVESKKRQAGFFKKKYITDSLSLNLPDEYFFEDENADKKTIKKRKKEKKLEAIKAISETHKEEIQKEPRDEVYKPIIDEKSNNKPDSSTTKKRFGLKNLFSLSDEDLEEIKNEPAFSSMPVYKKYNEEIKDAKEAIKTAVITEEKLTAKEIIEEKTAEKEQIEETIEHPIEETLEEVIEKPVILEEITAPKETLDSYDTAKEDDALLSSVNENNLTKTLFKNDIGDDNLTKTQIVLNSFINEKENPATDIKEDSTIINEDLSPAAKNVLSSLNNQDTQDIFLTKFVETDTLSDIEISEDLENTSDFAITNLFSPIDEDAKNSEDEEESVFEEYISMGEIFDSNTDTNMDITSELQSFKTTLSLRIAVGFIGALALSMLTIFATSNINLPEVINPISQPMMFYLANLVIFSVVLIAFIPTIISGFRGLFKNPTPDSFISVGGVLSILQLIFFTLNSSTQPPNEMTIFASIISLSLAFNALGKRIATDNIIRNLKLAYAPEGINVGYILKDTEAVKRISRTLDSNMPNILLSRKTSNITNFLKAGFSISDSDIKAKKTAIAACIVTAISFIISLFISKSFLTALSCATGAAVLQIPLAHTMIVSVPSSFMQKKLKQVGALVNGWQGIDQLSKTTHVTFDAKHLFPKNTIVLHGIRPAQVDKLDSAILYASSVLISECENLKPIFMQVIKNNTDILYPVDSCEYTQNQGYVAWVNKNRVLVGNRQLMEKYDIPLPSITGENSLAEKNQKPIYISVNGQLYGVFIVSYHMDEEVKKNLDVFVNHSRNIILTSRDFNVDARLVEKIYNLPLESVGVLNQQEFLLMQTYTDYTFETEACVAHLDNLHSLTQSFKAAEAARIAQTICSVVQNLSVAVGGILALLFSYSLTIPKIPLLSIQLISLGFAGLTIVVAYIKKY